MKLENNCRLESWKGIAKYLNRSVRTVRRWEELEGLPVHRHHHGQGTTVFAYPAEIEAWYTRRAVTRKPDPSADVAESINGRRWQAPALIAAGVLSVFLVLLLSLWQHHFPAWRFSPTTRSADTKPAWILVTDIDDRVSSTEMRVALESILDESLWLVKTARRVPQERLTQSLRLMRAGDAKRLRADSARELAIRDGDIPIILVGRIVRIGNVYTVSVDLLDPKDEQEPVRVSETLLNTNLLPWALDRLKKKVSQALVTRITQPFVPGERLARVTTDNLRALRLYTHGIRLMEQDRPGAAGQLLQTALDLDRKFAAAIIQMAWALRDEGREKALYLRLARRALELSDELSLWERYFIRASYHHLAGEYQRAGIQYEALLALQPGDFLANRRGYDLCTEVAAINGCEKFVVALAKLRPQSQRWNYLAARALALRGADSFEVELFAKRAGETDVLDGSADNPQLLARAQLLESRYLWSKGNSTESLVALDRAAARIEAMQSPLAVAAYYEVGRQYLALGRIDSAEEWFDKIEDAAARHEALSWPILARGRTEELARHLRRGAHYREPMTALLLVKAGLNSLAETMLANLERTGTTPMQVAIPRAYIALQVGDVRKAIETLNLTNESTLPPGHELSLVAADLLSRALEENGQMMGAIYALESTYQRQLDAALEGSMSTWMQCQRRLARLYNKVGREHDGTRIRNRLRKLLAHADPGHALANDLGTGEPSG